MPLPHFTPDALLRALACANPHCPCQKAVARGSGVTHCPAHDDGRPSLSVSVRDGRVLWNCFAGCDGRVITDAIYQLFPKPERSSPDVKEPTVYDYGAARHLRLDLPDGTKRMWWEPKGTRMADLPLWNGDMLAESRFDGEPVLLVEGEKDANNGVRLGFLCVSLPGGASQRDFGKALEPLAGRDVVLIPDQDKPGLALMQHVAAALAKGGAKSVRILELPPSDHDLSDFLKGTTYAELRGARQAVKDMIENAEAVWP